MKIKDFIKNNRTGIIVSSIFVFLGSIILLNINNVQETLSYVIIPMGGVFATNIFAFCLAIFCSNKE